VSIVHINFVLQEGRV